MHEVVDSIKSFEGGELLTRAYLTETPGGEWILIDAPADTDRWLDELGIEPVALLLTHQHFDHIAAASRLAQRGIPIHSWSAFDRELTLESVVKGWGLPIQIEPFGVDHVLSGRERIQIGGLDLELRHVPGHSPDSVVFFDAEKEALFAGDTLFAGSTGRADLPMGDMEELCRGIREKLYSLPPRTRVFPGHGPETRIDTESRSNPIVRG
jgi:glyoxylase-like metal-dependent hydrolase (beta-lactamase superfamily II)